MIGTDWVLLHSKIQHWQWYRNSNMVHIFIHLLVNTNRKPSMFENIPLERGQLVVGLHSLSEKTGISVQKVRTCLKRLESSNEIVRKSTNKFTIITMCNFNTYQFGNNNKQQTDNKRITNEQQQKKRLIGKEVSKKKTTTAQECPFFDKFWEEYPRKIDKQRAKKIWLRDSLGNGHFDEIMNGLKRAKDSDQWMRSDGRFIPHPTTWLNGCRWEDDYGVDAPDYERGAI